MWSALSGAVLESAPMITRLSYLRSIPMALVCSLGILGAAEIAKYDYRLLATTKTSTMEKELNEAAAAGFSFSSVMGGETGIGGKEVVVVMAKKTGTQSSGARKYKLLATSRTSTMQKELQQAGDEGFDYCGQTVFQSTFGGREVSVILESDPSSPKRRIEFKLLATTRTSTMEKELKEAGDAGFEFLDVMVGSTAMGGKEVVSILRRYSD
jgi:hypothetical protein